MDKQEQEPASSELSNSDNVFNSEIKQSSELSEKPEDTKLAEKNDTPSTNGIYPKLI